MRSWHRRLLATVSPATWLGLSVLLTLCVGLLLCAGEQSGSAQSNTTGVENFGSAGSFGSPAQAPQPGNYVGIAAYGADGITQGYYLLMPSGQVVSVPSGAPGTSPARDLTSPAVAIASTASGQGYWIVTASGQVVPFGDAQNLGDTSNINLNSPIVDIAPTTTGNGYWLLAEDGGIFSFGAGAVFFGSTGTAPVPPSMVGMVATPDNGGYWLLSDTGGVYPFGDASSTLGSPPGLPSGGYVAIARPLDTASQGYWTLARNGAISSFGAATGLGSFNPSTATGVALASVLEGTSSPGYWIAASPIETLPSTTTTSTTSTTSATTTSTTTTTTPTTTTTTAPPSTTTTVPKPTPKVNSLVVDPTSGPPGTALQVSLSGPRRHRCTESYVFERNVEIGNQLTPSSHGVYPVVWIPGNARPGQSIISVSCSRAGIPFETGSFDITSDSNHFTALETSLPNPSQVDFSSRAIAETAAIVVGSFAVLGILALILVGLLGFPAEIFNDVWDEEREHMQLLHLPTSKPARAFGFLVYVAAGGVLIALLSPDASPDNATLWQALGAMIGLGILALATGAAYTIYGRLQKLDRRFHLILGSILVAAACVALSRGLHLQPGYLYGLIAGFGLAKSTDLQKDTNGRLALCAALIVLFVSLVAWFVRPGLMQLHGTRPEPVTLIAVAALSGLIVTGIEALAFGLLPLPFLPGARIWQWNKLVWSCLYAIALALLVKILLLPNHGFVSRFRTAASLLPVLLTFTTFMVVSLAFLSFWWWRRRRQAVATPAAGTLEPS